MDEAEDDLLLALDLYLDILVDIQGDGLDRGRVDVQVQVPPVPGLLGFVFGKVVAQVLAQAQPRLRSPIRQLGTWPQSEGRCRPAPSLSLPLSCFNFAHKQPTGSRGSWQVGEALTRKASLRRGAALQPPCRL